MDGKGGPVIRCFLTFHPPSATLISLMRTASRLILSAALLLSVSGAAWADSIEENVKMAQDILAAKQGSAEPIPQDAIKAAKGVAIFDLTKGGLIFGGTGGSGVVLVKGKPGFIGAAPWLAPIPITFSGGSFGAQIGGSSTKAIVLLNSDKAVKIFTNAGKLAWDGTASGTAGNDSGTEVAGGVLNDADVKIYKDTSGLYGGATFGGASLNIAEDAIKKAYGKDVYVRDILDGKVKQPEYAASLVNLLNGKR
jgi:lipid-binding SYLF domain-containing protein